MRKNLLVFFAGLSILVGLFYFASQKPQAPSFNFPDHFNFSETEKSAFRFSNDSDVKVYVFGKESFQNVTMNGTLNVRVLTKKNTKAIVLMQFSGFSASTGSLEMDRVLTHLYSQPFLVTITTDGRIVETHYKGNDQDYKMLNELLYDSFQVLLKNTSTYDANETTPECMVECQYIRDELAVEKIHKRRLSCLNEKNATVRKLIADSNFSIEIDKQWIKTLHGQETTRFYTGMQKTAEATYKILLEKNNSLIDNSLFIWQYKGDAEKLQKRYINDNTEKSYIEQMKKKAQEAYYKKNNITLKSLLDNYSATNQRQKIQIADYLKLHPEETAKLFEFIKHADDRTSAALINVLELAGTPEAQKVLRDIVRSIEFKHNNHLRAIVALGGLKHPTKESIDFLWQLYENRETSDQTDLSNTAMLSLGIMEKGKEDFKQRLIDEYRQSTDNGSKKSILLLSMKNAGAEEFKPQIFDALKDENSFVKTKALNALKNMNGTDVQEHLLSMFNTNERVMVRRRVIETLLTIDTNDQLMSKARENILQDDDSRVRYGLIRYLLKYKDRYPENIDTLKELRKKERDRDNQILLIKNGF